MRSKEALLRFLKDSVNGLLHETYVKLCELHSHMAMQFIRRLLSSLIWGYFHFHHNPQGAPKYHVAESTTTVLANRSKKGTVELCVMKSHIRKQSLRKLLSKFYVRILLFSPWPPMGSQISPCRIHDNSVSKLFQERKGGTPCDEVTHQKAISQKASLLLLWEEISFFNMGP